MKAMRKSTSVFCALVLLSLNVLAQGTKPSRADSLNFVNAPWETVKLGRGSKAMSAQMALFNGSAQSVSVVRFKLKKHKAEFVSCPSELQGTTSEIGKREKSRYAINGSYFHMNDRTPATYFRKGQDVLGVTDPSEAYRCNGLVAVSGKRMAIIKSEVSKEHLVSGEYDQVLSSGPILISEGSIMVPVVTDSLNAAASFNNTRHPRSIIGYDDKGYDYLVVVDGRFPGQADGATIYECAAIAYFLGMTDALNLDGGGSSALWTKKTGVLSHPCDNKTYDHDGERKVPNCIVIK